MALLGRSSRSPIWIWIFDYPPILGAKSVEKLGFPNILGRKKNSIDIFLVINWDFFLIPEAWEPLPTRSAQQSRLCGLISNCFPSDYFFLDI